MATDIASSREAQAPFAKALAITARGNDHLFAKADTNNDGSISRDEALLMFMEVAGETEGTAKADIEGKVNAYFDKSDTNKDGVLSREEFDKFCAIIDGMSTVLGAGASKSTGATVKLKTGRSGATAAPEQWSSIDQFRRFDVNKDAKLDVTEATQLITAAVAGMGLTTDWVTTKFVTEQARRSPLSAFPGSSYHGRGAHGIS